MEWQRRRTDLLLELREPCYMINHFLSSFGRRHVVQLYTFRTSVSIVPWEGRLPRRCSHERSLRLVIFRIFGCLTFSRAPSEKRTKLQPTTKRGIFVGYDETLKAFRIYLFAQRKVVVRREVRFEERAFKKSRE